MQVRRKHVLLAATVLMIGLGPIGRGVASAQDRVTLMMRSGEKLSGRFDGVANDRFYLDISDTDERHIPMGDIAVIDFTQGANNLPETELSQARGGSNVLVTRSGDLTKGQLDRIEGARIGEATVRFRAEGGGERRVAMRDVARIYLGNYPGAAPSAPAPSQPQQTPQYPSSGNQGNQGGNRGGNYGGNGQTITVPGNQQWVDSGLTVRQGEALSIRASGEVVLSADPNDKASPNGALGGRHATNAPLPQTLAGALIGRIGNGRPFGIGAGPANINAPDSGRLYLGVNDDGMGDNTGQFQVSINTQGNNSNYNNRRNPSDQNNQDNQDNQGRRRRRP
jgi:hypothetical protein